MRTTAKYNILIHVGREAMVPTDDRDRDNIMCGIYFRLRGTLIYYIVFYVINDVLPRRGDD